MSEKYEVRKNRCKCHPETCCCFDWAVYNINTNEKYDTFFLKRDAEEICFLLNGGERSIIDLTFEASDEIKDGRLVEDIFTHLVTEVGELAQEIIIENGFCKNKLKGSDGIIGKAVDVIICALDVIKIYEPLIAEKEINEIVKNKLKKWKK